MINNHILLIQFITLIILIIIISIIIRYFNIIEGFNTTIYTTYTTSSTTTGNYGKTCSVCEDGKYPNIGSTSCVLCPPGMIGTGGSCTSRCPQGKGPNSDSTSCENCSAGTISTDGICVNCGLGKYRDGGGFATCENCPANKGFGNHSGRTNIDDCRDCPTPYYYSPAGQACIHCQYKVHHTGSRCNKISGGYVPDLGHYDCDQVHKWISSYLRQGHQQTNPGNMMMSNMIGISDKC